MGDKLLSRRKLIKMLRRFGVNEVTQQGGSSHRQLIRVIDGKQVPYTLAFHRDNEDIQPSVIKSIRARFHLSPQDGVSDHDFYEGQ